MSAAATDDYAERKLDELRDWFHERGHSFYVNELPGGHWVAFYPDHVQAIGSGPNEKGPTALDAALAAWAEFMDGRR